MRCLPYVSLKLHLPSMKVTTEAAAFPVGRLRKLPQAIVELRRDSELIPNSPALNL